MIDSNLVLLDLVGSYDLRLVADGKFNKLSKYTIEDYRLLNRLKQLFRKAVTTSHVLAEVSNLTGDLPESTRKACLGNFSVAFQEVEELAIPALDLAQRSDFAVLGLTDSGLAHLCDRFLVVSDDGRMVTHLGRLGLDALNFNHLRSHLFR